MRRTVGLGADARTCDGAYDWLLATASSPKSGAAGRRELAGMSMVGQLSRLNPTRPDLAWDTQTTSISRALTRYARQATSIHATSPPPPRIGLTY